MHAQTTQPRWALILGASSGFGEACARALAHAGYDIAGVHLDRKAGLAHVEEIKAAIGKQPMFNRPLVKASRAVSKTLGRAAPMPAKGPSK